ncbi:MAG: hypothetical protein COA79_04310 [Planctomycetota bacterium]|nr:MAG: hypothetical protein COA79_04310 [Planctomycetota bacterium]
MNLKSIKSFQRFFKKPAEAKQPTNKRAKSSYRESSVSRVIRKFEPHKPAKSHKHHQTSFKVKLATSLAEKKSAHRLAYEVYFQKGYIEKNINQEHLLLEDQNKDTAILMVEDLNGRLVGSVTIVTDQDKPLPSSHLFHEEIEHIKHKGSIAEYTRFVISENARDSNHILSLLLNYAYMYSYHLMKKDYIICEVNPKHQRFYARFLAFNKLGDLKKCPLVKNAPAVFMYQEINEGRELLKKCQLDDKLKAKYFLFDQFLPIEDEKQAMIDLTKQNKKKFNPRKKDSLIYSDVGTLQAI